jgi:4-amino-4-deoxy-L-arabinose transferase-like glycosyltransferase
MHVALFVCSCLLFLVTAALLTAAIPLKNRTSTLIAFYVIFWTLLVLVGESAALTGRLNDPYWHAGAIVILASIAFAVWHRRGRRTLLPQRRGQSRYPGTSGTVLDGLRENLKRDTDLTILAGCVALLYGLGVCLISAVPPNSGDSYGTYLARAASWVQSGTLRYPTDLWTQLAYPIDQQLAVAWTMLLAHSDRFVGYFQWVGAVVSMLTVYGIARRLDYDAKPAAFSALLWGSFPMVLWHSTSALVDIGVTSFVGASVYFLYSGLQDRCRHDLWLSGLAIGLAFGTKQAPLFVLPGIGIAVLLVGVSHEQPLRRHIGIWILASLVGFASLSALTYVGNVRQYGNPMGPRAAALMDYAPADALTLARTLTVQAVRYTYLLIDVETGLPPAITRPLVRIKATTATALTNLLRLPVESDVMFTPYFGRRFSFGIEHGFGNEQRGAYGIVFGLLFLPAVLIGLARDWKTRHVYTLGLTMMFVSLLVGLSAMRSWSGVEGRYFMPGALLVAPLFATFYRVGWAGRTVRLVLVATAVATATSATLMNFMKPLVGESTIWNLDRLSLRARFFAGVEPTWDMIDQLVPETATIACARCGPTSYYLFGEHLGRTVHFLEDHRRQLGDAAWFEANRIEYLLSCAGSTIPPGFVRIGAQPRSEWNPGCRLYQKDATGRVPPHPPGLELLLGRAVASLSVVNATGPTRVVVDNPLAWDNVDPKARALPLEVTGRVVRPNADSGKPLFLAVALNGEIVATTRAFSRDAVWMALLPRGRLQGGRNDVEVFVVDPGQPLALVRTRLRRSLPTGVNLLFGDVADSGVDYIGFFRAESAGGVPFHWTNGDAAIRVPLEPARKPTRLSVDVLFTAQSGTRLQILLDGCEVLSETLPQGKWSRTIDLGRCVPATQLTTLRFQSDTHQPGGGDSRRLGVALARVALY